jgi:hypothetical protein
VPREVRDPLDRVHHGAQLGEDGGLVAGARADVEHAVALVHLGGLTDDRDHVRLGDRLAEPDPQGHVEIGAPAIALLDEGLAWNTRHGVEHAPVHNPSRLELLRDHAVSLLVEVRHRCAHARASRQAARRRSA